MSETNVQQDCNPSIVDVKSTSDLPYKFEPFTSVERARAKYPCGTFFVYTGIAPKGFVIVAYPILLEKPEDADEQE